MMNLLNPRIHGILDYAPEAGRLWRPPGARRLVVAGLGRLAFMVLTDYTVEHREPFRVADGARADREPREGHRFCAKRGDLSFALEAPSRVTVARRRSIAASLRRTI